MAATDHTSPEALVASVLRETPAHNRARRLSDLTLEVNGIALAAMVASPAIAATLLRLVVDSGETRVRVGTSFDLPADAVTFDSIAGMNGGILADGSAHT